MNPWLLRRETHSSGIRERCSASDLKPFEDNDSDTSPREMVCNRKPDNPGADNHNVGDVRHRHLCSDLTHLNVWLMLRRGNQARARQHKAEASTRLFRRCPLVLEQD